MTTAVQICNEGQREISVNEIDFDKDIGSSVVRERTVLKPGERRTFHIHLLRDLRVEEEKP